MRKCRHKSGRHFDTSLEKPFFGRLRTNPFPRANYQFTTLAIASVLVALAKRNVTMDGASGDASTLLAELSFWDLGNGKMEERSNNGQTKPIAPTKVQPAPYPCSWKTAKDPATGKIYYYDVITRKTQWEKVRDELGIVTSRLSSLPSLCSSTSTHSPRKSVFSNNVGKKRSVIATWRFFKSWRITFGRVWNEGNAFRAFRLKPQPLQSHHDKTSRQRPESNEFEPFPE